VPDVNLSKVQLSKAAPTISLTKDAGAHGTMRINLNWSQPARKLFSRGAGSIDLDLACLWETTDGRKGVVQALGNSFGSLDAPPYVYLDGDDRSGSAAGGENMLINLDHLAAIKRVLVFTFIYEGAPNWAAANGVVTLYPQGAAPIEIHLDEASPSAPTCAIAMLRSTGHTLTIDREVRYIQGMQEELDHAYGWGMNWRPGRK
jgi:tellurite resistance protein TerA